jgi:exodeoxyribonuclease-5
VVVFSRAAADGDKPLRPSPLLAGLPASAAPMARPAPVDFMAAAARIESLDDHRAPPLPAGEKARGGVGLLKAQAICPAWAFHRYRLGAQALAAPVDGLDAASRGTLLHRAMERFWNGRDSVSLQGMSGEERQLAVATAVAGALSAFDNGRELPLSPRFAQLECARLERLLNAWLEVELARPQPFTVLACEQTVEIDLDGLKLDIRVDRIDELTGRRRVILDYKTGRNLKLADWQGERIVEPQLPAYAVSCEEPPAVVAFAKVRDDGCAFVGLGEDAAVLPGARAAEDWPGVLTAWRASIRAVAREIREGEAAMWVADEKQLEYCDVLPLLRLPEYRAQREQS